MAVKTTGFTAASLEDLRNPDPETGVPTAATSGVGFAEEAADLLYQALVLLSAADVGTAGVAAVLSARTDRGSRR